jgi:hypothetical protein
MPGSIASGLKRYSLTNRRIDLSEHLDRYRKQQLVLIIAPVGEAEPATYISGVCGLVISRSKTASNAKCRTEHHSKGRLL